MVGFGAGHIAVERFAFHARRFPSFRSRQITTFANDLRALHDVLENTELDGHYWIWGGLLLGWAREGAILSHDAQDADFGLVDDDFSRLVRSVPNIVRAGFSCARRFINNSGDVTELTFKRHGASFEFFRLYREHGRLRYYVYNSTRNEAIEVQKSIPDQPTTPFSFLGRTWFKHDDHDLELRSMYGSWEVPDPKWSFLDGPNVEASHVWQHTDFVWRHGIKAFTGESSHELVK